MRRLLALMSMTLAVSAAGAASAHDATRVIYDLSSLQRHPIAAPAPSRSNSGNLPLGDLPMLSPSHSTNPSNSDVDLDNRLLEPKHGGGASGGGRIVTSPGGGKGSDDRRPGLPNPEPGTMLLLGSGLLATGRFLRRRTRA